MKLIKTLKHRICYSRGVGFHLRCGKYCENACFTFCEKCKHKPDIPKKQEEDGKNE